MLFDLSYQLAYYKAYHLHQKNVAIHLCCIPLILASAMTMLYATGKPWILYSLATVYSGYYIILHRKVGAMASAFLVAIIILIQKLNTLFPPTVIFRYALTIHILSWAAQFYGHFHFEKRSPAVLDNLVQPLVLAPYFVLFELLFNAGYERKLHDRMLAQAVQLRRDKQWI